MSSDAFLDDIENIRRELPYRGIGRVNSMCFCGAPSYPSIRWSDDPPAMFNPPVAPAPQPDPFYNLAGATLPGGASIGYSTVYDLDPIANLNIVDLVYETIRSMSVEDYIELQGRLNDLFGTVMVSD